MQRRNHLTGVQHGPTSRALDPTLCNCDPTLCCSRPTHLTAPLTARLAEQTLRQWTRTSPARHATRCTCGVTVRAPRLTVGGTPITPYAGSATTRRQPLTQSARRDTPQSWTIHAPTSGAHSVPARDHRSRLEDHDARTMFHLRRAPSYGLSPLAHAWYDDSHIVRGTVNQRQDRTLAAYRGALAFIGQRPLAFAPELSHLCERLDATVDAIQHAAGMQELRGGKLLGDARRRLDQVREKHMLPLARLTRRLFAGETRIQEALEVPHKRAATRELFAASRSIVKTLRPHRKFLADSRIDTRRIDRLQDETRQVKQLFDAAATRTPESAIATRRLNALFAEARADFAAIDGLVILACSPEELRGWRMASRVGKRKGRPPTPKRKRRAKKGAKKALAKKSQAKKRSSERKTPSK